MATRQVAGMWPLAEDGGRRRRRRERGEGWRRCFLKRNKKRGSERKTEATVTRKKIKEMKISGKGGERVME